jgi:arabinoxylan arabinofuranohydrolase
MKKVSYVLIIVFTLSMLFSAVCYADNPVVQTVFTADPAPMVYNGTLYLYTSHDEDSASNTFVMKDWRCYSTTDMVNWVDQGVILNTQQVTWSNGGSAYAGQCVARNGKFYWYFPTTSSDGQFCIGVAVSSSPTGTFTDIGHPLVPANLTTAPSQHSWEDIDPTVFVDDDGQAYLYWGNNMCYWVKLNSDMISYSGTPTSIALTTAAFGPDYEEAPWLWKHNGLYYLAYVSSIPESIQYSTSSSPTGPWTYKGCIMPVQSGSNGNHPGIIDYNGKTYFFGFNQGLTNSGTYKRSVCVKQFTYNSDGTIPNLQGFSTTDPTQIGTLNPFIQTEAETICWESGVETETCSEGGIDVGFIENGDYIKVKGVNFGSDAAAFDARVASGTSGGKIELRLDSPTGTLIGTCTVSGTGGWQTWTTKSCSVSGATGTHDLYLKFTGGSGYLFNVNWWKFR